METARWFPSSAIRSRLQTRGLRWTHVYDRDGLKKMREILTDILTWSRFSEPHGCDFNGHLVRHADGNLCIDPVEPDKDVVEEIGRHGLARILLTNRNHSRAANLLRERTGARVAIHPDDAAHARSQGTQLDDDVRAGEAIGPLVAVAVPGKSPGEVAFHWPARRLLIMGDAVIGHPPGRCGLLREAVIDDTPRLRASVRALLDLDFDTLLVGDGVSILRDAKARLSELVESFPR